MEAFWCLLLKSVRRFWHLWHLGVGFCRLSFSFSVEIVFVFNVVSDLWLQPGHLGVLVWDRILFKSLSRTSFLWRSWGDRAGVQPRFPTQLPWYLLCGCKFPIRPLWFHPAWEGRGAALFLLGGGRIQVSFLASTDTVDGGSLSPNGDGLP